MTVARVLHGPLGFALVQGPHSGSASLARFHSICARLGAVRSTPSRSISAEHDRSGSVSDYVSGSTSTSALRSHTEHGRSLIAPSIVALYCESPAVAGGQTFVVSGASAFIEMRRRSPEALYELMQPVAADIHPASQTTQDTQTLAPVFVVSADDSLSVRYPRYWIERASESHSDLLKAAIEMLDEVLMLDALQFEVALGPGDSLFVSNSRVLHGRRGFRSDRQRRLHRSLIDERHV